MGIKYFFAWVQRNFEKNIHPLKRGETVMDNMACGKLKLDMVINNLMLDMNGIFHNSAQKIFEYGNFKKADDVLLEKKLQKLSISERIEKQNLIYADVCENIDKLVKIVGPTKRLILCIDGPAPLAKQNQQRQRRFRAAKDSSAEDFTKFDSNCVSGETMISLSSGRCRPVKFFESNKLPVVTLSEDLKSLEMTEQINFLNQGEKEVVEILFQDGRQLTCTPDHLIALSDGTWKRAGELTENDGAVFGIQGVIDIPQDDEKDYRLEIGDFSFSIENDFEREKLLAFARILGIILTGGCSNEYTRTKTGKKEFYGAAALGSIQDVQELIRDIELVAGQKMSSASYDDLRSFKVNLPAGLASAIYQTGILLGGNIDQKRSLPAFILEKNCPKAVIREFLGGYFGGDGRAPGFGGKMAVRRISLTHSYKREFQENMKEYMTDLVKLLNYVGVEAKVEKEQIKHKYEKYHKSNGYFNFGIIVESTRKFVKTVGFRYCHAKNIRAEAIASYERLKEKIISFREKFLRTALGLFNSGKARAEAYQNTLNEILKDEPLVLHPYCIPSYEVFTAAVRNGMPGKLGFIRHLSLKDYLKEIGALRFFGGHAGGTDRVENAPAMSLGIIGIKTKPEKVSTYDISVASNSHSFLANGIGVHNCITPGTKFMDFLSKYIDWYIRKKISTDAEWRKLEIIFSSEKVPGEGEHKLLGYYRYYGVKSESFCIYANDADLIMLTLGTHNDKFYVLRDCMYDDNYDYYILNTPEIANDIIQSMRFESKDFDKETVVNDFIFLSFMVGNDFLPNIPSLEIIQKGIEIMFDVYRKVGEAYGHLTENVKGKGVVFRLNVLRIFLGSIGQYEKGILEGKYRKKDMFFEDKYLDKNMKLVKGKYELNVEGYKKDYYKNKLEESDVTEVTRSYLEGMQWVLSYYTQGTPAWRWFYPYNYAPFASDMAEMIESYSGPKYKLEKPILPFLQLLTVLPPRSAHLLPNPLNTLLYSKNSPMAKFCPRNFPIDLSGKKREWEGLVILPTLEYQEVINAYNQKITEVSERDLKRNIAGKSYIYTHSAVPKYYSSFLGDIPNCHVGVRVIDL